MHKCMPHGKGVLIEENGKFEGDFEHGDFISGTITYADGSKYNGQMKQGEKMGANSEFTFDDGEKYTGDFSGGKLGKGTVEKRDGTSYSGDLNAAGQKHGHGKYTQRGVMEYEGEFQEDEFHGKGYLRYLNKPVEYKGDFANGQKNGHGVLTEANGGKYDG